MVGVPASNASIERFCDLAGQGFVVLGAGQGIGRATCLALRAVGARVVCVDRDAALAKAVASDVEGLPVAADVTSRQDMTRIFAEAANWIGAPLSGLVDIVGIADVRQIADMDDEAWNRQFDIVLRHAFLALQCGPEFLSDKSAVVFVSSISGMLSVENQAAYGAAKAALNHLVRAAAHELGPRGIRVNAVAPGFVRTPRLNAALGDSFWRELESCVPLRRAALPEDIAKAILFLASDMSSCITGAILPVDGGISTVAALPKIPLKGKAEATRADQAAARR